MISQYLKDDQVNSPNVVSVFNKLAMDNMLMALNVGEIIGDGQVSEAGSVAAPEEDAHAMISLADHLKQNQNAFATSHPSRSLGHRFIVQSPGDLYASNIRHNFIKPQWYRPDSNLKYGGLNAFIDFMIAARGSDRRVTHRLWSRVLGNPLIHDVMLKFAKVENETELREWFAGTSGVIKASLGEHGTVSARSEMLFGLGGALAYTDPHTGEPHNKAAYLSYADKVFMRDGSPFAGIEFKFAPLSENKLWYKVHTSALPQTLCATAGHPCFIASLFLCNYGFRVIWRKLSSETLQF